MFINSLSTLNSSPLNINIPILQIRKFIHKKVLSLFTVPCCFLYIYPLIFILCIYLLIYSLIYLSLATSPVSFPVTLSGAALAKLLSLNESIVFPFQSLCTHSFHFLNALPLYVCTVCSYISLRSNVPPQSFSLKYSNSLRYAS